MPWTVPLLLAVATCLLLFNTVGQPFLSESPFAYWNEFGWPATYLKIDGFTAEQWAQLPADGSRPRYGCYSPRELPTRWEAERSTFDRAALEHNLRAALGISIGLALVVELWQRRRENPPPLTIRRLMILTAMVALFAVLSRNRHIHWHYWSWWPLSSLPLRLAGLAVGIYGLCLLFSLASEESVDSASVE